MRKWFIVSKYFKFFLKNNLYHSDGEAKLHGRLNSKRYSLQRCGIK